MGERVGVGSSLERSPHSLQRSQQLVNAPFLAAGGSAEDFRAGIERAVALGWLWEHESGTYLKFIDAGAKAAVDQTG
jgi:hypothetical protein